ncbi:Kirola like [Actinidia chinensis var. chinensis]|uniref:Kirola like n=1 Tax=Actinidia chinensis var. chinensis TaxID=1590841 RepID=A0A2R6PAW5_ACTCC|nr:Kirola like [Actinidia chinensis var. chinensis]
MGLSGEKVIHVEIKSPGEGFLDIFGVKKYELAKVCPDVVQSVQLLEGEWGAIGCRIHSHLFLVRSVLISEESSIIAIDKENKSLIYNIIGGDIMNEYNKMHVKIQVTSQGETNFLTWTLTLVRKYEEGNENGVNPEGVLVDFVTRLTNSIDAHFLKEKN